MSGMQDRRDRLAGRAMGALSAALLAGSSASAQPQTPGAAPTPRGGERPTQAEAARTTPPEGEARDPLTLTFRGGNLYIFESDLDDSPGTVSINRAFAGVGVLYTASPRLALTLDAGAQFSSYLFDDATGLIPGSNDPWEQIIDTVISPGAVIGIDRQWAVLLGLRLRFAGEPGADIGDAFTIGGFAGARYAVSETLALTFGVSATTRLEDDPFVFPLLGFEWDITDRVSLSTRGPALELAAEMSDSLTFLLDAAWNNAEFRLDDDGPLPDAVVRDNGVSVGAGLAWSPSRAVRVTLRGGAVVWQEYEVDDSSGNEVSEVNTDPAAYVSIAGEIRF